MPSNKFLVVGTGIRTSGQLTMETISWIKKADKVFYVVADPLAGKILPALNKSSISMHRLYGEDKDRAETYEEMVQLMMKSVRKNKLTIAAFYGHPGILADAPHETIRRAKKEGYIAEMLPAISAEACLYADLGVDPSTYGCQSHEATSFLVKNKIIDNTSALILWQIGVLGVLTYGKSKPVPQKNIEALLDKLYKFYPPTHEVTIYEAATVIGCKPRIEKITLSALVNTSVTAISTLYIPPSVEDTLDSSTFEKLELIG